MLRADLVLHGVYGSCKIADSMSRPVEVDPAAGMGPFRAHYMASLMGADAMSEVGRQHIRSGYYSPFPEASQVLGNKVRTSMANQADSKALRLISDLTGDYGQAFDIAAGLTADNPELRDRLRAEYAASGVDDYRDKTTSQEDRLDPAWLRNVMIGQFADRDYRIANHTYQRHERPVNYWLNPIDRTGPFVEMADRLARRHFAGVASAKTNLGYAAAGLVPSAGIVRGGTLTKQRIRDLANRLKLYVAGEGEKITNAEAAEYRKQYLESQKGKKTAVSPALLGNIARVARSPVVKAVVRPSVKPKPAIVARNMGRALPGPAAKTVNYVANVPKGERFADRPIGNTVRALSLDGLPGMRRVGQAALGGAVVGGGKFAYDTNQEVNQTIDTMAAPYRLLDSDGKTSEQVKGVLQAAKRKLLYDKLVRGPMRMLTQGSSSPAVKQDQALIALANKLPTSEQPSSLAAVTKYRNPLAAATTAATTMAKTVLPAKADIAAQVPSRDRVQTEQDRILLDTGNKLVGAAWNSPRISAVREAVSNATTPSAPLQSPVEFSPIPSTVPQLSSGSVIDQLQRSLNQRELAYRKRLSQP